MRWITLIVVFFLVLPAIAQEEMITWSAQKKLNWQDFKGAPDLNNGAAAITASGISYEFSASIEGNKVFVDYVVNCFFYPQQSWYKKELSGPSVLRHEQLHFDITELHARIMRAKLCKMNFTENVRKQIKKVYKDVIDELQRMQKQYDEESDFSRNPEGQLKWEAKIASALKMYDS